MFNRKSSVSGLSNYIISEFTGVSEKLQKPHHTPSSVTSLLPCKITLTLGIFFFFFFFASGIKYVILEEDATEAKCITLTKNPMLSF